MKTRTVDGYWGWASAGPFDEVIVTRGIDHVPPRLLHQMKTGGIMVIPIVKVMKSQRADRIVTASPSTFTGE